MINNKILRNILAAIFIITAVKLSGQQVDLIPYPQEINLGNELVEVKALVVDDLDNQPELIANEVTSLARKKGLNLVPSNGLKVILKSNNDIAEEGYQLNISKEAIELSASTEIGHFYALQTFHQLIENHNGKIMLPVCQIKDSPAFSVRGFMHDVGRNFISMKTLKQQVRIMARYKLNVFHWHLTEDIAWRLEIKQYPELTAAENMIRNPGQYYTQKEALEFVNYCENLGITVIPEIDMPGHSAAFERAMGVDMQSERGAQIVKNILGEVCQLFPGPYIHIGGDEVKITNRDFLPEMIELARSYDKIVIGWRPGGNLDDQVVEQLWTGNPKPLPGIKTIDSRHLYINHNDPLSGVIKTFNHKICDADQGDDTLLGAILCSWPDRRVANEHDVVKMNGFYPSILAFAERSWRGGGYLEPTSSLNPANTNQFEQFAAFESRLINHRDKYFQGMDFPYVRHTNLVWNIAGPFPNEGDSIKSFPPEKELKGSYEYDGKSYSPFQVTGGTVWLRHMWHPMIKGELKEPEENATAYAYNYVFSEKDQELGMWISFHNPGRANVDDTPKEGTWDFKGSRIWINDHEIPAPNWSKPGRNGHMEIPLLDESYEWREPTRVQLKAGWNKIFMKLPIGEFTSPHTRPVKWMFTAVFVNWDGKNAREVEGLKYSLAPN